jgi:inner membrane transporter RhtA
VCSTIAAQGAAVLAVTLYATVAPAGVAHLRLVFAAAIMLAIWRPWRADWTAARLAMAAMFGLAVSVLVICTAEALARMPVATVVPIQLLGPLAVGIAGRKSRVDIVWILLAAVGVLALLGPGGSGLSSAGIGFALASAAGWAGYILVAARLGEELPRGTGVAVAIAIAALLTATPAWATAGAQLLDLGTLAASAGLAILGTVVVFTLETTALRRMPLSAFGVFMALEPAVAALWGLVILGQSLGGAQIVGLACIALAAAGATAGAAAARRLNPP